MRKRVAAIVTALALAGCGGGGGSTPPTQTGPTTANTALPYYLPLASGNTWTFSSGGKIVDMGSGTASCTCPVNGKAMEQLALYGPNSSTIASSFFMVKNTPAGGTQITYVAGVENDANTNNITYASTTSWPYGIPIMDDSPFANESWNDGAGDTSTITSVGGTMAFTGNSQIVNVASDQVAGSFGSFSWEFAKGVGVVQLSTGGQSTSITSFSVNAASSMSIPRSGQMVRTFAGHAGKPDYAAAVAPFVR